MPAHRKPVLGRGINDAPFPTSLKIKSYRLWNNMLSRCYGKRTKANVCYTGCEVDPVWFSYMTFKEWFDAQGHEDWALEKDLLKPGNKVYGPETCVMVPPWVNQAIVHLSAVGYSFKSYKKSKQYHVAVSGKWIGAFDTEAEAETAWRAARINAIAEIIDRYKLEPNYDPRVVEALEVKAQALL